MSKPEWCPQRVWDEVQELDLTAGGGRWDLAARAILAAEQREREACKAIADNYAVEPDPDETDPYDEYEMGGRSTARQVSRLIANRGEHHD